MWSFRRCGALLAVISLAAVDVRAEPVVQYGLVKDIATASSNADSDPHGFVSSGGQLYFSAKTPATGIELFVSDGVSPQARLIADLAPGGASSFAQLLGSIGDTLIVSADADNRGSGTVNVQRQAYAVNRHDGTRVQLTPFPVGQHLVLEWLSRETEFPGHVVMRHNDGTLWATDGTRAGTQRLHAPSGPGYADAAAVCALPDRIVFQRNTATSMQLWISNGRASGTGIIAEFPGIAGRSTFARGGDSCFFLASRIGAAAGWAMVQSDGTAGGSGLVGASTESYAHAYAARGNMVFWMEMHGLGSGSGSVDLRRSDRPESVWSAQGWHTLQYLTIVGDHVVFAGTREPDGIMSPLYVSDGTTAGTRPVMLDGAPFKLLSATFVNTGTAALAIDGERVVRIDPVSGTATAMTSPVSFSDPAYGAVLSGGVYFGAYHDDGGREPWRLDGTPAGTRRLADVATANRNGVAAEAAVARGGKLIFRSAQGGLWRSDGTDAGTHELQPSAHDRSWIFALLPFDDGALFATYPAAPEGGQTVYRVDMEFAAVTALWGSPPGFNYRFLASPASVMFGCNNFDEPLCAFRDGALMPEVVFTEPGWVHHLGRAGTTLLFYHGGNLWRSDGTAPGTYPLLTGQGLYNSVSATVETGGKLWFEGCHGDGGANCRLIVSDGTVAGTRIVATIEQSARKMAAFGDGIVFLRGWGMAELWRSDGTAAGTTLVTPLQIIGRGLGVIGGRIHVLGYPGYGQDDVYMVSDGTAAGTRTVGWAPGLTRGSGDPVALDADTALFACHGDTTGDELCAIDRLGNGMRLVADFYQGPESSSPTRVAQTGGASYFALDDGRRGRELWRITGDRIFGGAFE